MAVFKIVDHYQVEDVDLRFQCPDCGCDQTQRFRSNLRNVVTYCNDCELTIQIKLLICPSCNSTRYVIKQPGTNIIRCLRCNVTVQPERGW